MTGASPGAWSRTPVVDGGYRRDEGARRDDFFPCRQAIEVMALRAQVHGTASPRARLPFGQDRWLSGLQTVLGSERMQARPGLLLSDEARRHRGGCTAHPVRQGLCQRGRTQRQGERRPGPLCPATLAHTVGPGHVRDLEALCNGGMRAWAQAGVLGTRVPGMREGTDRETPHRDPGWGPVTRQRRSAEQWGRVPASEVTVDGWTVRVWIEAVTTRPLAVQGVPMPAQEARWPRALVPQRQAHLAGQTRLHTVVCERGLGAGPELGWLDQHGMPCVVPATDTRAGTADARARAAAGEGVTMGHRVHTVRHGPGHAAGTERLEPEGGAHGADDVRAGWDRGTRAPPPAA